MNEITKANNPVTEFRKTLEGNMRTEIAKQLPKGIDPDRFIRTTITTVQMNPELLEASRSSLFASCMQAAKDGLLPDGREATIQIYNTKVKKGGMEEWVKMAQYMPMVRGLIKKMYGAGCAKIDGVAVYEKDEFVYELGDDPKIEHRPYMGLDDPGLVVAAYAIIKLENGEVKREVMPRRDIEKIREASKSSKGPGWTTWYDQFAIKGVLKRIYKQIPERSDEFESVIDSDNQALGITFDKQDALPVEVAQGNAPKTSSQRLVTKIKGKAEVLDSAAEEKPQERAGDDAAVTAGFVSSSEVEILASAGHPEDDGPVNLEDIKGLQPASKLSKENEEWLEGYNDEEPKK